MLSIPLGIWDQESLQRWLDGVVMYSRKYWNWSCHYKSNVEDKCFIMHAQFFSFSSFQFERELFYNITELIGRDLWSIRVQTLKMTSWWYNLLCSFSRAQFSEKMLKTFNIIVKNKSALIFHGPYTLFDHRNMIEMTSAKGSKLWVLNILTSFLWPIKV